jgi:hypothetical protein
MKNEEVIKKFLSGLPASSSNYNLRSTGNQLINYNTIIAEWKGSKLHLNVRKYSHSTSVIQGKLRSLAVQHTLAKNILFYEPQ